MASGKGQNNIKYSHTVMKKAEGLVTEASTTLGEFANALVQLIYTESQSINGMSETNVNSYRTEEEEKEDGFSLDELGNKIKNFIKEIFYLAICSPVRYKTPTLAKEAQRNFNGRKINGYKDILDGISKKGEESYSTVSDDLEKLTTAFNAIKFAVESFESGDIDLYEELIESGERNNYVEDFKNVKSDYDGVEGVDTIFSSLIGSKTTLQAGAVAGIWTKSKDVGAVFFTDVRLMMSGRVASEIYCLENNITGSDKQNFVIRAVNQAHETTETALVNGYFDYTTTTSMAEVYREKLGIDVSPDEVGAQIENDYKSIIEEKTGMSYDEFEDMVGDISGIYGTGSLVSSGLVTVAGFAAAGTMSFDTHFTEEEKEAINEVKEAAGVEIEEIRDIEIDKKETVSNVVESQATLEGAVNAELEPEVLGESIITGETEVTNEPPETGGIDEGPLTVENIPNPPRITPEVAQEISAKIQQMEENQLPSQLENPKPTSSEIDKQVRDEYYASSQLAEDRVKAIEQYDAMPDSEKISNFEKFGYTAVAAAGLVADRAAGQTAFILGLEEQNLAALSNSMAAQQGLTNHVTGFGTAHSMDYINSGQANIDLTPTTQAVQDARTNMDEAKAKYNSSVNNANDAIKKANSSKDKYNNTLNSIKNRSGDDPKDWSEEDVEEYNKAAKEYNAAVDEANKSVAEAEEFRGAYEKGKEEYSVAYEEYRKQAEEALKTIRENDGGEVDIIEEVTNVENVPTISENIPDEGTLIIDPTTTPNENTGDEELIPNTEGIVYDE